MSALNFITALLTSLFVANTAFSILPVAAYPHTAVYILRILFAVWFGTVGGLQLLVTFNNISNRQKNWFLSFLKSILHLSVMFLVIFFASTWNGIFSNVLFFYLFGYAVTELIRIFCSWRENQKSVRRGCLPFIAEFFISDLAIKWIRSSQKYRSLHMYRSSKELQKQDQNVEVLVHLSNKKGVCWGHVDIALGDTVYSFGNYDYDKKHRKFFGLVWEGVLFTCNREKYMNFSLNVLHNVIISYRLRLSDMEKATIREHLQALKKNCHPWLPDQKSRYARALSRLGADLFKFNKGAFRTYFVFNANCAFLVETLLSGTRLPRLRSGKGLVSPGSLIISYELENMRKHGGIESRQIYAGSCLPPVLQL